MRLITVVMNEEDTSKRSSDTTKMLDYGFNTYLVENIIDEEKIVSEAKVSLGKKTTASITAMEKITILSKKSDEKRYITYKTHIDSIIAPVKKGDKVGTIDILEEDKIISTIDATVKEDITKANIFTIFMRNLKDIIKGELTF